MTMVLRFATLLAAITLLPVIGFRICGYYQWVQAPLREPGARDMLEHLAGILSHCALAFFLFVLFARQTRK
jgi:hypothetical protein